jgi:hypothetical protein
MLLEQVPSEAHVKKAGHNIFVFNAVPHLGAGLKRFLYVGCVHVCPSKSETVDQSS